MPSEKTLRPYQSRLPLTKATLWDQLPEPTRTRVRQLLAQMLQQASVDHALQRPYEVVKRVVKVSPVFLR